MRLGRLWKGWFLAYWIVQTWVILCRSEGGGCATWRGRGIIGGARLRFFSKSVARDLKDCCWALAVGRDIGEFGDEHLSAKSRGKLRFAPHQIL